jgi:hypothetical protein
VARDASGNFSAGTITAALSGNASTSSSTSGNAATATALQTARTINGTSFNGTANITITAAANGGTAANITGQANSATITASTAATANQIVLRDGSGDDFRRYGFSSYFNSSDDVRTSGVTAIMGKFGDNYYRSGTAAAVATFISGQTMNIAGSSTTLASGQSNWSGTGVLGNVVGLMAWKNYGNSHVIFDASQSTSPSGGAVSNTNAANAWSATYPTLMGWNGSSTYGVRVDSARVSDSANALNSANNYSVTRLTATPNTSGVSTGITAVNGDMTAYRSGGTTGVIYLSSAGSHYLYWDGTNYNLNAGNLVCTGNVTAYSDERLKKDWAELPEDFIAQLAKVKHGTYTRIDSGDRQAGVSAQQVQAFLPEVVQTDEKRNLTLAYGNAALVAAVKLAERVVALEARIAALEAKG